MRKILMYLLISLLFFGVWQYFSESSNTVRLYISSPMLIWQYTALHMKELLVAFGVTFIEALLGLVIASISAFAAMLLCFVRPTLMQYFLPVMIVLQIIPIIVLAPFFIVLFGVGVVSKIAMAALISFFPIFISFAQGYRAINKNIHELMFIYGASLKFRIMHMYVPLAFPSIMAGLKVSATLAVIGAIVAEFTGAKFGIGKNLFISTIRLNPDLMMSSLIFASIIGLILYGLILVIEKRYGLWYLKIN